MRRRNLATSNPVRRVKLFHEDNSRLRYLSREDYDRLLKAARTIDTSPYLEEKIIPDPHWPAPRQPVQPPLGSDRFREPRGPHPPDKKRPAALAADERDDDLDASDAARRR